MEKEKKMIIILSIISGALLLLLILSSGYNYKQYNDNNTCASSTQNVMTKQQQQLKELINVMNSKNTEFPPGMPTPEQLDCLLKQVNQKYTPFDVLYNIISFGFASLSQIPVSGEGANDWIKTVVSTLKDMRTVGCGSVNTCNIPSSSSIVKTCQQPFM